MGEPAKQRRHADGSYHHDNRARGLAVVSLTRDQFGAQDHDQDHADDGFNVVGHIRPCLVVHSTVVQQPPSGHSCDYHCFIS